MRGYGRKGIAFLAISGVDISLCVLKAKALGVPLYRLLGPYADSLPEYGSSGWTNFCEDELVEEMRDYVEQGIPRVKFSVGKDYGRSEREDIRRVKAVRRAVGDDLAIYIDANNVLLRRAVRVDGPGVRTASRWAGSRSRYWRTTSRVWPRSEGARPYRWPPASTSIRSSASRS